VVIDDRGWIGSQLQHLRRLGARIAIDDFGTGVAGLSHLRELPYDVVKIDRSYVDQVGTGSPGEQLVAQIIELAKGLGATLVAEGIETPEQLARLTEMGCDVGQGFHLARPMPAEELERWMVEGGRARPVNRRLSAGTGG
jgi:c-di-GMP phosphodiesterase Gmr